MLDFKPPKDTPFLFWWAKINLPLHMKFSMRGTSIKIMDGALERFAKLKGKHTMVCPNHSNRHDPQIMFSFGVKAGEYFNFVAAREVFDYDHGVNGWWLQHLGTYSVVRGAADRESFKTTRRILSEGQKKLVLFPEGEISRQNDTIMPLESGAAQLSFWAMADLEKKAQAAKKEDKKDDKKEGKTENSAVAVDELGFEPVYIQPMAFKYTYPEDIASELRGSLKTLEMRLGLKVDEEGSFQTRIKRLAETLLSTLEREYNFKPKDAVTMNDRVKQLRVHILQNLAGILSVELEAGGRELEWVRVLRNKLDDFIYEDEKDMSEYEKEVHAEKEKTYKTYYKDLNRVVNFISIYDGYVSERSTQERIAEVLERMETEVLGGESPPKGAREVMIDVGEAINLGDYWSLYKKNKKEAVNQVTDRLFSEISRMLAEMDAKRKVRYL
ncbi:MAG: 1-acyl-sn-glycerol-3-phosphate acyltransferase [Candidatus Obscuribacter phosphatis]|uniref:1-acyl-sn-glycerol-3-phosphate acyltransferase n=1 Tax=Candidatus Obscuribacter phosphatis TaxID=1906157 RepID=A0A8J7PH12_9BACT|nr:1-acyl-sn-glycerol-3-phosphate acyltransferase [Candidatus Obscuribacter phosphatis]